MQRESKYPTNVAEENPVLGIPRPRREEWHVVKNSPGSAPRRKSEDSRTCTRVQCRAGLRKSCHFHIECTNKRPDCINRKRPLNGMVSVTATNRRWGKMANGTRTQVVICLTNRWKVRIKQEGLCNVRIPSWKQGGSRNRSQAGRVKERVFFDKFSSLLCKHLEYHDQ